MEITDIRVHVLKPLKPRKASLFDLDMKIPISLLRVLTDEGIEGNCMMGLKLILPSTMAEVLSLVKPFIVGKDPFDREKIWQKIFHWGEWNFGVGIGPVLSVLDIALWDIAGKAFKTPIYKILGTQKSKVRAYASTLMYPSIEDYVDNCTRLVEKGYTAIKLHPWGDPKRDIELCRSVRQAIGYKVDLMLDALCGAYDRLWALKIGRELDKLDFTWYEDPLVNSDIEGCAKLAQALDTPIKLGEGVGDWIRGSPIRIYHEYIIRGAADIIGSLGDVVGGITGMRKIADFCEIAGVGYEPHNYGTPFIQAAHLHTELTSNSCKFFELPVPEGLFDVGTKDTFRIDREGYVCAPTKPGLGVEVDWEEIDELTLNVL